MCKSPRKRFNRFFDEAGEADELIEKELEIAVEHMHSVAIARDVEHRETLEKDSRQPKL